MDRPAHTLVLPVPLSRMLAAYTRFAKTRPNIGTEIFIPVTNAIEAVHRQFRKLTKTKGAFRNENSLLKLLYMGIQNASKNWTMPLQNWKLTLSQLAIYFEGRLDDVLDI